MRGAGLLCAIGVALSVTVASGRAQAQVPMVYAGNDTGGIIPWSPEAVANALDVAQANCSQFNKYAVITSVHRVYGDYIAYACWWHPPRGKRWNRS